MKDSVYLEMETNYYRPLSNQLPRSGGIAAKGREFNWQLLYMHDMKSKPILLALAFPDNRLLTRIDIEDLHYISVPLKRCG